MTRRNLTVLIVNDCLEDRETYRRYLLQDPDYLYTIWEEESGEKALAVCKQKQPDGVLLDSVLPDLTGLEFLSELRQQPHAQNLPVVVLTGHSNTAVPTEIAVQNAVKAIKLGADDYLVEKEISPQLLRSSLRNAIETAELRRALSESEARIRQHQQFIQQVTETAPGLIYIYDLIERRTAYANHRTVDLLGYSAEELEIFSTDLAHKLMHSDDYDRFEHHLEHLKAAIDGSISDFEYRMQHANGEWRWFYSRDVVFSRTADGTPRQILGTAQDITERKQLEQERNASWLREKTAREQAEIANHMKDEFLAVISHELRSPLNAILGWTKLVRSGRLDPDANQRALETIERNAKAQSQLIDDLLDVSRLREGKLRLNFAPVNLVDVIEAAIAGVQPSATAKQIALTLDLDRQSCLVRGDFNRLQQVVLNLLSNAIKFTPQRGEVTVRLSIVTQFSESVIEPHSTMSQLQVIDTGKGIRSDFLPHVFDRFEQADRQTQEGLGLGLSIVRQLVELHGGTVSADSAGENLGAVFTVLLPLLKR